MANYDQDFYQSNYGQQQQWGQTTYSSPQSGQPLNLFSQGKHVTTYRGIRLFIYF